MKQISGQYYGYSEELNETALSDGTTCYAVDTGTIFVAFGGLWYEQPKSFWSAPGAGEDDLSCVSAAKPSAETLDDLTMLNVLDTGERYVAYDGRWFRQPVPWSPDGAEAVLLAAASDAVDAADRAEEVLESIPEDFTEMEADIVNLKSDLASVEESTTASKDYAVGEYLVLEGVLYEVTAEISSGATITPNTNVIATTVAAELEKKADTDGNYPNMTVGNAEQLVATVGVEDKVPYLFRTSGGSADIGDREVDELVGGTVAWNQLVRNGNFASTTGWSKNGAVLSASGNVLTATMNGADDSPLVGNVLGTISGHKYFVSSYVKYNNTLPNITVAIGSGGYDNAYSSVVSLNTWVCIDGIIQRTTGGNDTIRIYLRTGTASANDTVNVKDVVCFDLTAMFGSTIADYIYSLEQNNAGDGVAWFRKLFPKDYYAYDAGTLMSVKTSAHRTVGFNAYDNSTGKAKVVSGQVYQITGTYTALSLNGTAVAPDEDGYFTSSGSGELTVTGGDSTTCIHLKWDGSRDGEYEPYESHSYALDSDLELRGVPKLDADNKLYYDGDTYESDGTVTRRYGIVDLGTLSWSLVQAGQFMYENASFDGKNDTYGKNIVCSKILMGGNAYDGATDNVVSVRIGTYRRIWAMCSAYATASAFKTAMNGVYMIYELATPTTESADPFTNPQIVNDFGTEEYADSRAVPIPVGHDTVYQANLRAKLEMAPDSPDGDGDYIVRQSGGQNAYVPLVLPLDELPAAPDTDGTYVLKVTVASGEATYSWVESNIDNLSINIKDALLQNAAKAAYIDDDGQDYYDALHDALYPPTNLLSISAIYTQSGTVYDTDSLDSLKANLVVTATYDDSSTATVTAYALSGTLTVGTSTITVSYGGKTDTFTVTVTQSSLAYVTDGLFAHWDAIDNQGTGTHDSAATTWVDLINEYTWTAYKTDGTQEWSWDNDALVLNPTATGNNYSYGKTTFMCSRLGTGLRTLEVVFVPDNLTACVGEFTTDLTGITDDTVQIIGVFSSDNTVTSVGVQNGYQATNITTIKSISATYDASYSAVKVYKNATELTTRGSSHSFRYHANTNMILGSQNNQSYVDDDKYAFKGKIYSIRMYNKELSASEIAQNYAVDVARFGLS